MFSDKNASIILVAAGIHARKKRFTEMRGIPGYAEKEYQGAINALYLLITNNKLDIAATNFITDLITDLEKHQNLCYIAHGKINDIPAPVCAYHDVVAGSSIPERRKSFFILRKKDAIKILKDPIGADIPSSSVLAMVNDKLTLVTKYRYYMDKPKELLGLFDHEIVGHGLIEKFIEVLEETSRRHKNYSDKGSIPIIKIPHIT